MKRIREAVYKVQFNLFLIVLYLAIKRDDYGRIADMSIKALLAKKVNAGRISTTDNWNTSVLKNEIAADIKPLFKAVKNDEPNILKPLIKKAKQNIWKPCLVIMNRSAL